MKQLLQRMRMWFTNQKSLFDKELELRSRIYALTSQNRVLQRQQTQMFRVIMFVADGPCVAPSCDEDTPCASCAAKSFLGLHGLEHKYQSQPHHLIS
jgi:hypothetical protein